MQKLNTYIYYLLQFYWIFSYLEPIYLIYKGYRNVVIQDWELLKGASIHQVQNLFNN
jgi:hypothetical protein